MSDARSGPNILSPEHACVRASLLTRSTSERTSRAISPSVHTSSTNASAARSSTVHASPLCASSRISRSTAPCAYVASKATPRANVVCHRATITAATAATPNAEKAAPMFSASTRPERRPIRCQWGHMTGTEQTSSSSADAGEEDDSPPHHTHRVGDLKRQSPDLAPPLTRRSPHRTQHTPSTGELPWDDKRCPQVSTKPAPAPPTSTSTTRLHPPELALCEIHAAMVKSGPKICAAISWNRPDLHVYPHRTSETSTNQHGARRQRLPR